MDNINGESNRELLVAAIRSYPDNNPSQPITSELFGDRNMQTFLWATPATDPLLGCNLEVYWSVLNGFWFSLIDPSDHSPIPHVQAPISISAKTIISAASDSRTLSTALFSVAAMYLGRQRRDDASQSLAISSYAGCLSRFRNEMISVSGYFSGHSDALISVTLSLMLFEVSSLP